MFVDSANWGSVTSLIYEYSEARFFASIDITPYQTTTYNLTCNTIEASKDIVTKEAIDYWSDTDLFHAHNIYAPN